MAKANLPNKKLSVYIHFQHNRKKIKERKVEEKSVYSILYL